MDFKKLTPEQMKVAEMVIEAAEANKIDPNLLLAQAFRESGFRHIPNKETDAFGVMQIRPGTAEQNQLGDITDLRTNIFGGAKLMRQYLDKYKSPEAALLAYHQGPGVAETYIKSGGDLKSVGPKGLDYVINIGENGGFGQPAKSEDATKQDNANNPFAGGVPLADKAREGSDTEEVKKEPVTLLEKASALANEIDPAAAAAVGAVANVAGSRFVKPPLTPTELASANVQDKLNLTRQKLGEVAPQGPENLQESYAQSKGNLERLKNEQRLMEMQLKSIPPASPPPAPTPQEQLKIEARKITGAGAPYNTVQAFANERVPYNLAIQAMDLSHNEGHGKGAHDIVDIFNKGAQKSAEMGMSDYVLAGEKGPGELYLKQDIAEPKNAEIQQRVEANQNQQAIFEQQQQQERLRLQAELERIRQERATQGTRQNVLAGQMSDVKPLQRAMTKLEIDAEAARLKAARAKQNPNLTAQDVLNKGKAVSRPVVGGLAGAAGVMSLQEALERYKAGDTSEGVLKTIQASSAAAMLTPPVGKNTSRLRKAGALGAIGSYGYDFGRELFRKNPQEGQ